MRWDMCCGQFSTKLLFGAVFDYFFGGDVMRLSMVLVVRMGFLSLLLGLLLPGVCSVAALPPFEAFSGAIPDDGSSADESWGDVFLSGGDWEPGEVPETPQETPGFPSVEGMVRVSRFFSGCSGSLVAFDTYRESDEALVLTNGHCTGKGSYKGRYPGAGEIFINQPPGRVKLRFYNTQGKSMRFAASALRYATMLKFDIAFYALGKTYGELQALGFEPLIISRREAVDEGQSLLLASSYWRVEGRLDMWSWVGQHYAPATQAKLLEGPWSWWPMLRLRPTSVRLVGGMSGSPLLDSAGQVVGLLNTGYTGGEPCSVHNPCEVAGDERLVYAGAGYAMPLATLYGCVDEESGTLDIYLPECPLPN